MRASRMVGVEICELQTSVAVSTGLVEAMKNSVDDSLLEGAHDLERRRASGS